MGKVNFLYRNKTDECVLFLHGWGGSEYSFLETFNQLKNRFSVLSINLSNITSNYLNKPLTLFDYAIKVSQILVEHNIKNVHIVCHSFGFRIALILNKYFNFEIKSMVIVDGAGVNFFEIGRNIKIFYFKILKILVKLKLCKFSILNKFGSVDYKNLNKIDRETFKNIVNYNLKKYVDFINIKTTIIWGKYDVDTKIKIAKFLHKNIKQSVLKIYNTGHFSYIENKYEFMCDIEEHFDNFLCTN